MKLKFLLPVFLLGMAPLIGKAQVRQLALYDPAVPESVVKAVFRAADTRDLEVLPRLCDPEGQNDGDTRSLCQLATSNDQNSIDEFVRVFRPGRITGATTYVREEDTEFALVPFRFNHPGKKNRDRETMKLVKREGAWYLYSF